MKALHTLIFRAAFIKYRCFKLTKFSVLYSYRQKAIPLQAWTGPEGSRRLRLPDFKTIGT